MSWVSCGAEWIEAALRVTYRCAMHEFSLCRAIAATVEHHADGRPVDVVHVDIGHLRQVVPETLVYCWQLQVADTPLEHAQLAVNHVAAVIQCRDCGSKTTLDLPVRRCANCESVATDLLSGEEFMIVSIDLGVSIVDASPVAAGQDHH